MKTTPWDVVVIGSGPAGLAAAWAARQRGAARVLVVERNQEAGGILPQCIHNGFGLRVFQSDLTGPEYAGRWERHAREAGVELLLRTMVLDISRSTTCGPGGHTVVAVSRQTGLVELEARALVLAMGCRERPRGALSIPGTRPAGIYTAGTAQRLVNIEGFMPGNRFVILGSGDIGMIMARRLTLEGARVVRMLEILPFISGLRRNLVQCVRDYDIPLSLSTTVTQVLGRDRVEGVIVSQVDNKWQPIDGTDQMLECDALLLSVGLIPENELSRMAQVALDPLTGGPYVDEELATSVPGVYSAGNVVHVYDLVDDVTENGLRAGRYAARYAAHGASAYRARLSIAGDGSVHYVVPQHIHPEALIDGPISIEFRVRQPIEAPVRAQVMAGDNVVLSRRLRYVRPSEMVTLELEPSHAARLRDAQSLRVCIAQ